MNLLSLSYFLVFSFFLILIQNKVRKSFIVWIYIFAVSCLISFRNLNVPDTDAYVDFFRITSISLDDFGLFSFEIGFQLFTKVFKILFGDSFRFFFFLVSFLNFSLIYLFFKKILLIYSHASIYSSSSNDIDPFFLDQNSVLTLLLYTSFFGIYLNSVVIRVGLSMALVYLSSIYLINGKLNFYNFLKMLLLLMVAYFMHSSAFIGIIIFFILYFGRKYSCKIYSLSLISIGLIYYLNLSNWISVNVFSFISSWNDFLLLFSKLESYQKNVFYESGISMKFSFFWFFGFFLIKYRVDNLVYYKYLNVYFAGLLIFSIFRSVLLIERVTDYFFVFSFFLFFLSIQNSNLKFSGFIYSFIIIVQLIFVLRIINPI